MSLKEQLKDPSKDEEDVKAIARLFADMGDSYVDLIVTGSDEAMLIVQALLEVASHPEFDISSMTYNFWHSLQDNLTRRDSYMSYGSDASIEIERNRRLQIFHPPYEMLVALPLLPPFGSPYAPIYSPGGVYSHPSVPIGSHVHSQGVSPSSAAGAAPVITYP